MGGALEFIDISIHALRGEGDRTALAYVSSPLPFQSTPSVGRATPHAVIDVLYCFFISIHALRGEGDVNLVVASDHFKSISIHALRGEGDPR